MRLYAQVNCIILNYKINYRYIVISLWQIIFVKLYKMLEQLNSDHVILQYEGLYNAAITSLKDGLIRNSSKIENDFYLSTFHPILDYTLQVN